MAQNSSANETGITAHQSPYLVEHVSVVISRLCVESAIALFGLVWNAVVCAIISRQPKHTFIKFYIINLAIADIGILCLSFPIAVVKEQIPTHWPLGRQICELVYPLTEVFYGASVWSITAIAVERRRNIVRRFVSTRRSKHKSFKHVKWVLLLIWVMSFLTVAFPLFFVMDYQDTRQGTFCWIAWSRLMHFIYVSVLTVLCYLLPLVIITITYVQISRQIEHSNTFHRSIKKSLKKSSSSKMRSREEAKRLKQNATTKRFLTPVVLTFLFTFLPLNVLRLMVLIWADFVRNQYFLVMYNICVVCTIINSAANPLIYSIVSREFRIDLKNFASRCLPCFFSSRQDHSVQLVSIVPLVSGQAAVASTQTSNVSEQRPAVSDGARIFPDSEGLTEPE